MRHSLEKLHLVLQEILRFLTQLQVDKCVCWVHLRIKLLWEIRSSYHPQNIHPPWWNPYEQYLPSKIASEAQKFLFSLHFGLNLGDFFKYTNKRSETTRNIIMKLGVWKSIYFIWNFAWKKNQVICSSFWDKFWQNFFSFLEKKSICYSF